MSRIIFHCDLDCFFAAVEMKQNPKYREKPVIVGADPKNGSGRGVVSTCSYEARKFGLHSAMPISKAYALCPHGIYLRPDFQKYVRVSRRVMEILSEYSDKLERAGIDEAYLDVSERCANLYEAKILAKQIKHRIIEEIGITISIGCASTKSIAKIASDHKKPNGITIVPPKYRNQFLYYMDITRIPGIGRKSRTYYNEKGVVTIGDLLSLNSNQVKQLFGKNGKWAWKVAHGMDNRDVCELHGKRKSISRERTFLTNTKDFFEISSKIYEINTNIHDKLDKEGIYYRTITLKLRFEGFLTRTRSHSFFYPIKNKEEAYNIAINLLKHYENYSKKIRLIGLKFSNLTRNPRKIQQKLIPHILEKL
ncbi:MAG: DNA polymerase IV [Promethearchaeota archaeon]